MGYKKGRFLRVKRSFTEDTRFLAYIHAHFLWLLQLFKHYLSWLNITFSGVVFTFCGCYVHYLWQLIRGNTLKQCF